MSSKARKTSTSPTSSTGPKLRQTQAEYNATHPAAAPGSKPSLATSKMYVCRRCQANFKTGEGRPDVRIAGIGKCNACLETAAQLPVAA